MVGRFSFTSFSRSNCIYTVTLPTRNTTTLVVPPARSSKTTSDKKHNGHFHCSVLRQQRCLNTQLDLPSWRVGCGISANSLGLLVDTTGYLARCDTILLRVVQGDNGILWLSHCRHLWQHADLSRVLPPSRQIPRAILGQADQLLHHYAVGETSAAVPRGPKTPRKVRRLRSLGSVKIVNSCCIILLSDMFSLGPSELSIASPEAVQLLYGSQSTCSKGPWYTLLEPRVALFAIRDKGEHARRRKVWDQGFSTKGGI